MKTPDGRECKFFYGDYYRGRSFEECRSLSGPEDQQEWSSSLCKKCPLPNYLRNNACQNLGYSVSVGKVLFTKQIKVKAWCSQSHDIVKNPNIGCGHCHESAQS